MEEGVLGGWPLGGDRARQEAGFAIAVRRSAAALVVLQLLLLLLLVIVAAQRVVQNFVTEANPFSCARGTGSLVAVRGAAGLLARWIRGDDAGPVGDGQPAVHLGVDGGSGGGRGGGLRLGGDGPAAHLRSQVSRLLARPAGGGASCLQVAAELPAVRKHIRIEEVQPEGLSETPLAAGRAAGCGHRPVIWVQVKVKVGR